MLKLTKEEIDACLTKLNSGDLLWVPYDPSTLKVGQYFLACDLFHDLDGKLRYEYCLGEHKGNITVVGRSFDFDLNIIAMSLIDLPTL